MKSEHLGIGDRTFLINRLIQQAPINTLVREFFKNAEENAALAPEGKRTIRVYPTVIDGINKLTFWNTGVGMDDAELRTATDLSSSLNKVKALDGNFGIGAKVSGLAASPEGIRYRSCKNGTVNEVTIGWDEAEGTYVRQVVTFSDGSQTLFCDVTAIIQQADISTDSDWTEVVLLGQSPDHDTVEEPIGKGVEVDRSFIATSIFRRFASFSSGVEVSVDVAMTKGGGKDETGRYRKLRTLNEILDRLGEHEDVIDPESGVEIRYIHDPKHETSGHTLSARANPAVGSTTFCALIYKEERYDFKTRKAWSSVAPSYGMPFGSRVLTVEIRLPDKMAQPSQYRDTLTWPHDRSPLTADQFAYLVRQLMPEWVKEVIRQETPDQSGDLKDLQSDLQALLDELRVPTKVLKPSVGDARTQFNQAGLAEPEPTKIESEEAEEPFGDGQQQRPISNTPRASSNRIRLAPEGATASKLSRALERAPEITILFDPEQIAEKGMKGRAAKFYQDAQALFVNGLYPVVEKMAAELAAEFPDAADPEEARALAVDAAQRTMAFRVGKATCFALAKKLLDDWSMEDLERATSPESLSMAADDYRQSLRDGKKYIKEQIKIEAVAVMA
jgi:hypothetical protein